MKKRKTHLFLLLTFLLTFVACATPPPPPPAPCSDYGYSAADQTIIVTRFNKTAEAFEVFRQRVLGEINYMDNHPTERPDNWEIKKADVLTLLGKGTQNIKDGQTILNSRCPDYKTLTQITTLLAMIISQALPEGEGGMQ